MQNYHTFERTKDFFTKETHKSQRRLFLFHLITLVYNIDTVALYFNSPDEFFDHTQYNGKSIMNGRITQQSGGVFYGGIATLIFFCSFLFISNQRAFSSRLENLFEHQIKEPIETEKKCFVTFESIISSTYKSIITSSSLFALTTNFIGFWPGLAITFLCLPGNFFAQFSVFLEHFVKNSRNTCSNTLIKAAAWLCALSYSLSNAALYFNAWDNGFKHCGIINNRLTKYDKNWQLALLIIGGAFSFLFIITTQISFSRRIRNMIEAPKKSTHINPNDDTQNILGDNNVGTTIYLKEKLNVSACVTAVWKTAVTSLSIIGLLATHHRRSTGLALAALFSVGNYIAQLTLYAPSDNEILEKKNYPGFFTSHYLTGPEKLQQLCCCA